MMKSYLKVALRSLQKNKLISFINIFGLSLSMSVGLMLMIRLQDAFSYDKFHPNADRIFRITSFYNKKTGERRKMASTPLRLYKNYKTISFLFVIGLLTNISQTWRAAIADPVRDMRME